MKLKEFKEALNSLPAECDDYEIVCAEEFSFPEDTEMTGRMDFPVLGLATDSENKEVLFQVDVLGALGCRTDEEE